MKSFISWLFILALLLCQNLTAAAQDWGDTPPPDVEDRSKRGDPEAVEWMIRHEYLRPRSSGEYYTYPQKWSSLPDGIDKVALVMSIVSKQPRNDAEKSHRHWGIFYLYQEQTSDPRCSEFFERISLDQNYALVDRWDAMKYLAKTSSERAKPVLLKFSTDPDPYVRAGVVEACAYLKDPVAEEILVQLANQPSTFYRINAEDNLKYWRERIGPQLKHGGLNPRDSPKSLQDVSAQSPALVVGTASESNAGKKIELPLPATTSVADSNQLWFRWLAVGVALLLVAVILYVFVLKKVTGI